MTLTVGVLGLGSIGMRHARNLLALEASVLGYDQSAERRDLLVAAGGRAIDDRSRVLAETDAVVVASPSAAHLADLADAIAAGRHVFVEKPLAHTDAGLDPLLDEADRRGVLVFAGMNMRLDPAVKALRQALADGLVGRPDWVRLLAGSYLPAWRPHQDYRQNYAADPLTGGVLFDFLHEFDLAVHLFGPAEVVGAAARRTGRLDMASEDCADVLLRHASGLQSTIHVDYVSRPGRRLIEVGGECGYLAADLENARIHAVDQDGKVLLDRQLEPDPYGVYVAEMAEFLACVRGEAKPGCDGRQAREVLGLVVQARRLSGLPQADG